MLRRPRVFLDRLVPFELHGVQLRVPQTIPSIISPPPFLTPFCSSRHLTQIVPAAESENPLHKISVSLSLICLSRNVHTWISFTIHAYVDRLWYWVLFNYLFIF